MVLSEDDLEFDFSAAIEVIRFDDNTLHGKSTMKRVDFIAEYEDRFVFLEVKDPDNPAAVKPEAFSKKLLSGNLIPDLAGKYRDTLWFRTLSGKVGKPVHYVVLLSMASLDPAPFAQACVVLNLDQYKKQFGASSVRRLSAGVQVDEN